MNDCDLVLLRGVVNELCSTMALLHLNDARTIPAYI